MMDTQQPKTATNKPIPKRPNSGDIFLFGSMTLLGAALDLWSKAAVFDWLTNTPSRQYSLIEGFLRFVMAENTGAAFSMLAGMKWFFVAVSVIALVVIQVLFVKGKLTPRLTLVALACMNAGVIGNLCDRLFNHGRVRDFIDVYVGSYHWPTFNVADSLLCIGVGILLISSFLSPAGK